MESDTLGSLAIDPGSRFLGVSWIECTTDFSKIVHAEAVTLTATAGLDKALRVIHDERVARLHKLKCSLRKYLTNKQIDYASTEGAFSNAKRPGAVIPLTLAIAMYTDLMYELQPSVYVKWISPSEVKQAVGASTKNKDGIKDGVVKSFSDFGYDFDPASLSEHALDSCAVNIARIRMLRAGYLKVNK